jgi:phytanoyl-CoA hydroxylase
MKSSLITPDMKAQFDEEGYLVVNGILDDQVIQAVTDDYSARLDQLAVMWQAEGKLTNAYHDLPFGERLVKITAEAKASWGQYFDISLPQKGVKHDTPFHFSKAIFEMFTYPGLLDVAETFVGPEIYSNPIQHTRIKPPERMLANDALNGLNAKVGWHQDQGVATTEQDEVPVLTVWLAITDANEENGCLCVVPRSHRRDLKPHCPGIGLGGALEIPAKLVTETSIPVPVKRGGALLLHRRTMHSSLRNQSDKIRWSFDLRYQPIGMPTGRPAFPGFVARSVKNPGSELKDWRQWAKLWEDTRKRLADEGMPNFNRWSTSAPVCA